MRWPKNFSSFNPSLLPPLESDNTDPHLVFFRVSNMNYCRHTSWKDRMRLQTHLRSYLALAHVDAHDEWRLRSPATVLRDASSLFRLDGEACARYLQPGDGVTGTFSGPEDPRAFWSPSRPHVPWLFVSAWTDDCARLRMHLVKLPGWRLDDGTSEQQRPQQLLLHVDDWPPMAPIADPESQPVQKNWLPFVLEGELFAEYSIEPHVILRIDPQTGRCVPALAQPISAAGVAASPFPSFAPLARVAARLGPISGGAAPLRLPTHHVYLGLGHAKAQQTMPQRLGTVHMEYKHFFYVFEDRPPFAIVGTSPLRTLPEPPRDGGAPPLPPTVQFAAGMALDTALDEEEIVISYSTRDCSALLTRVSLKSVLREVGLDW